MVFKNSVGVILRIAFDRKYVILNLRVISIITIYNQYIFTEIYKRFLSVSSSEHYFIFFKHSIIIIIIIIDGKFRQQYLVIHYIYIYIPTIAVDRNVI